MLTLHRPLPMNTTFRSVLTFLFVLVFIVQGHCREAGIYTIVLADKEGTPFSIDHPEAFLSPRSLQRRARCHIPVTYNDLPVSQRYIDSLRTLGMKIVCRSKWFNTVTAYCGDTLLLDTLTWLSFVREIRLVKPDHPVKSKQIKWTEPESPAGDSFFPVQLRMLHGDTLHRMGFTGKGLLISILDAGFYHADVLPAFDSLWSNGQIRGTWDFIAHNPQVFDDHPHGMNVLSILAGIVPGQLRGSAPGADYWLLRTEDVYSEYPVEEEYWTAGAEFADSVGSDIIHSSLGYSLFDNPTLSYSYQDMNGRTTTVARAAVMAARRGMIVVVSAGNEGNKVWHYIISPADADSILAVGAVDSLQYPASFTSFGPSSDNRVKPDVSAMGVNVLIQGSNGTVVRGSGTSFSSPLISGLTACLWQAFPEMNAQEIIRTVRESTDHYLSPDNLTGYGIPNYLIAYTRLKLVRYFSGHPSPLLVYPNPFRDHLTIVVKAEEPASIKLLLFDLSGRKVLEQIYANTKQGMRIIQTETGSTLPAGGYIMQVINGQTRANIRIVKIK